MTELLSPAAEMMNSEPPEMSSPVVYDKCAAVMSKVWVSQTPSPEAQYSLSLLEGSEPTD